MLHIALHCDRPASYGGIETHVATLAKDLQRLGQSVSIVFSRIDRQDVFASATNAGARLLALDRPGFAQFCRSERVAIVHAHSHGAACSARRLRKDVGIPWVATLHGPNQRWSVHADGAPFAVVCVSQEIADQLSGQRGVVVIENGVDLERFGGLRPGVEREDRRLRALYLGRVGPSKVEGLVALEKALRFRDGVSLAFVSDWSPGGAEKPTARVEAELFKADLVFSTGRGIREAMAAGCAAYVLGACDDGLVTPDTVQRLAYCNFSGRATRRRPTPERIANAVRPLMRNSGTLRRLGAFGRAYAADAWDARAAAQKTLELYRAAVAQAGVTEAS